MLVLMCYAGDRRIAIDVRHVVEVVSFARLERFPEAPEWIVGVFVYRGRPTPVADLSMLTGGGRCTIRWSSRIVVLQAGEEEPSQQVGLLVERTATAQRDRAASAEAPQGDSGTSSLGPLLLDDQGIYQWIEPSDLFSADRRRTLLEAASDPNSCPSPKTTR